MQIVPEQTDSGEAPEGGVRGLIAHHAKTAAWVDDVVAVHQEGAAESGALGFSSWIFTQLSLPYKDPGARGEVAWVRRNGAYTMVLTPSVDAGADGVRLAFPYGKYPRLILPWLTTEIVRRRGDMESNGALVVPIGESMRDFMGSLGQEWGGKSGKILREQARRLFRATIEFSQRGPDSAGGDRRERFQRVSIADSFALWWKDDEPEGQGALWGSEITVSPGFVASVLERPVPTDMRALRALSDRGGPLAMDIYLWLSHRLFTVSKKTLVPWRALAAQFGSQASRLRRFKQTFTSKLDVVGLVYPGACFAVDEAGLWLLPSAPAVAPARLLGD